MLHNEKQYTVYIETSIPSFYYTLRRDLESRAMQSWTQKWWVQYADQFTLVSSIVVINELSDGTSEKTQDRINLVKDLEMLSVTTEIDQIAQTYIDRLIMPQDMFGDAHHVALASFYNVDALLTWNYKHIANLNKIYRIRQINQELDLPTPELATPLNYLGVDD
ncbi:MAG: type II toxin-antitoxin system VapC family toxin [Candidatus Poribacteria bacterium]|nr:type II toxin-antitoxin system VapC family toxin [Candidatus Poribacteria bacterium]